MSNKEIQEFSAKLKKGLLMAEVQMLKEKALLGESVVVCDSDNKIIRIPASEIIAKHKDFMRP